MTYRGEKRTHNIGFAESLCVLASPIRKIIFVVRLGRKSRLIWRPAPSPERYPQFRNSHYDSGKTKSQLLDWLKSYSCWSRMINNSFIVVMTTRLPWWKPSWSSQLPQSFISGAVVVESRLSLMRGWILTLLTSGRRTPGFFSRLLVRIFLFLERSGSAAN